MEVQHLKKRLTTPLPNFEAHQKMMPPYREELMRKNPPTHAKEAAVLVLLAENKIILTKRKEHLKDHAGQISFAGGKREANETFEETALREAQEELGISITLQNILGKLSPLYIPPSNFWVHPYVAFLATSPQFSAQPQEVAQILQIPLTELATSATLLPWQRGDNIIEMPAYQWENHIIWGATAMILAELLALLPEFNS